MRSIIKWMDNIKYAAMYNGPLMAGGYDLNISAILPARTPVSTTPESCKNSDKILDMDQTSFDEAECEQKCEVSRMGGTV